ncbi:MAG: hypothetical protein JWM86_1609 [Thermoleophilia bacterium]|nr:hypothetical protein [Thermoleophilia bacterium]
MPRRSLLILAVFTTSCVIGPALDQIHVVGGALSYAHPWLLGQAWWVAPQFGVAFALLIGTSLQLQQRLATTAPEPVAAPRLLVQATLFVTAYLVTGTLHERPWLVAAMLAAGLALRIAGARSDRASTVTMALLAVAGTCYEAVVSSIPGTFSYTDVTWDAPVPVWLPLLYAHGAPLLRSLTVNAEARAT